MILQALTSYYDALREQDIRLKQNKISAPGWENNFKVSYELRLNPAGELVRLVSLCSTDEKNHSTPSKLTVPKHEKRSSGIAANFLCDTTSYLLGADEKGKPDRAVECFKACAELHRTVLAGVDSPAVRALLAFFDHWDPSQAAQHPLLAEQWHALNDNANLVFAYEDTDGSHFRYTEDSACIEAWQSHYDNCDADSPLVQCLVTGKMTPVERVHPAIKGVPGAQSSGAALISFNAPAFCSYGHEQGENAPIGKHAAFAYTTVLNMLLADREHHCRILGKDSDTTAVVCWAESADPLRSQTGMEMFFGSPEGIREEDLFSAVKALALGREYQFGAITLLPEEHFYVLGISPNAARLSVRFFLRDTFGAFARNLQRYLEETAIVRPAQDTRENLSVWSLALSTVRTVKGSAPPAPSPQLVGDLLRAVLTGGRYPATLLNGVTMRIRAEHGVSRGRAAALKAYYLRNRPNTIPQEVLTMSVNETSTYLPYVLGRLFSVLEEVQEAANPGINTTIKDRYFNSACATPVSAFPTLIKLSQKHLQKLPAGRAIYYNRQITDLMAQLPDTGFPARFNLPEQGAFEIGYYHQTQKHYTRKNEEE